MNQAGGALVDHVLAAARGGLRWARGQDHAQRVLFAALLTLLLSCRPRIEVWLREPASTGQLVFEFGYSRGRPEPVHLWTLDVTECRTGGQSHWSVAINSALFIPDYHRPYWESDKGVGTDLTAVQYGHIPKGYVQERPAVPLMPGRCYIVRTEGLGTGIAAFRVMAGGSVAELSRSDTDALLAAWHDGIIGEDGTIRPFTPTERDSAERRWHAPQVADSMAHARCYAGYRAARTRADTARVERMVPYDTTANGLLTYTEYPGRELTCQAICARIGPGTDAGEAGRRSRCGTPIEQR